eukprot:IDg6093t1
MNAGPLLSNPQLENIVADWVCGLDPQKLSHWVYDFMRRNHLSVCLRTHVGQLTKGHMQSVKKDFACRVMTSFKNRVHDPRFFCNMDETAVYFSRHQQGGGGVMVWVRIRGEASQN